MSLVKIFVNVKNIIHVISSHHELRMKKTLFSNFLKFLGESGHIFKTFLYFCRTEKNQNTNHWVTNREKRFYFVSRIKIRTVSQLCLGQPLLVSVIPCPVERLLTVTAALSLTLPLWKLFYVLRVSGIPLPFNKLKYCLTASSNIPIWKLSHLKNTFSSWSGLWINPAILSTAFALDAASALLIRLMLSKGRYQIELPAII